MLKFKTAKLSKVFGVPLLAQWLTNPTRNHEVWVRSLALLSGLRIQRCHELWCRSQTWLGSRVAVALAALLWLWLWHRPVATAAIQPLAWEPPYATSAALEKIKQQQQQKLSKVSELLYVESCSQKRHTKINKILMSYIKLIQN